MRDTDLPRRHLFLSPHPDDVVWSCGGQIAALSQARRDVSILCVFAGEPDVEEGDPYQAPWRHACRPSMRRVEERLAARDLGVHTEFLGFVEAALRMTNRSARYARPVDLLGPLVPEDEPLVDQLSSAISERLRDGDRVYVPRAVSSHVDHVLVRRAAAPFGVGVSVCFYDEFPYPAGPVEPSLRSSVISVPFAPWLQAALRYRSQVLGLFTSPDGFRAALRSWAAERGREIGQEAGVRLWFPIAAR